MKLGNMSIRHPKPSCCSTCVQPGKGCVCSDYLLPGPVGNHFLQISWPRSMMLQGTIASRILSAVIRLADHWEQRSCIDLLVERCCSDGHDRCTSHHSKVSLLYSSRARDNWMFLPQSVEALLSQLCPAMTSTMPHRRICSCG